jgi:superfamily II DNA or RNA helicase
VNLRPYQRTAIDAIRERWDAGDPNALLVLATGLGKTVVFCTLGRELRMEGIGKTLVLAHRKELLDQAREKWLAVEPDAHVGIYQGARREFYADVICASVQSCYPDVVDGSGNVTRRGRIHDLPLKDIGLVIVDECHHLASDTQRNLLATLREHNPNAVMLGVTATPYRNDGKGLGDFFDRVAFRMGIGEGIDQGFLAPLRGCRVELDIDLSQVKTSKRTGDFVESDLGNVMDTEQARREIVQAWLRELGPGTEGGGRDGRFTAAFTPTVESAQHLCQEFEDAGVSAVWVSGSMPKMERVRALDAYQKGEARVIVNCSVLVEGWDAPHTSCVLIARPTQSIGMYAQMVGRGTRLYQGKADCVVMDCVGASRLGLASLADLSTGAESRAPGIDPEEETEDEVVVDKDAKQLEIPELAQTIQVRGCTVYDIDLFGGQVVWTRIRGMRLAILDIGLHIVIYQEPNGGAFTAMLVDETAAIPFCKNKPERECLAQAEQMAMVRGRAKYLKPNKFQARMPATEKQMLNIQRLTSQNVALGGFDGRDVPQQMSMPQAMAWIAYLKTRRMWMRTRAAAQATAA